MGVKVEDSLTPIQTMLYAVIKSYVQRDSLQYNNKQIAIQKNPVNGYLFDRGGKML